MTNEQIPMTNDSMRRRSWSLVLGHWLLPTCRLNPNHELFARLQLAGDQLGEVTVRNARLDCHCAQLVAILNPDMPAAPFFAGVGSLLRRQAGIGKLLIGFFWVLPSFKQRL